MSQDETAVNEPVVEQETTTTESAPVETNTPEVADDVLAALGDDESTEETEAEPEAEAKAEPEEEAVETETEEQPQGKAEERKAQLNTEIRDLVSQRNALKQEVEAFNSQVYQPQSVDELVEQGYSETDARVAAMEQKLELSEYNNRVVEAQLSINEESGKILNDFPIFNPDHADYDAEIAAQAAQLLDSNLVRDPNTGQIIGSHVSPYQLYKPIADAYSKSRVAGQLQGQKATAKMLSSVEAPTSAAPREKQVDPILALLSSDD